MGRNVGNPPAFPVFRYHGLFRGDLLLAREEVRRQGSLGDLKRKRKEGEKEEGKKEGR